MSKPRPGVAAAKRLSKCTDPKIWELVESQYSDIVSHVKGLKDTEVEYDKLGLLLSNDVSKRFITKDELMTAVSWKFSVGKPRHALKKHLASNSEASVREHSSAGIAKARGATESDTEARKKALQDVSSLKGVGPATASAVLALARPDVFAYMYDEVIDCFLPKRTYTLPTYMAVNEHCITIAKTLRGKWTTARVATTLWTAARVNAYDLHDHTLSKRPMADGTNDTNSEMRRTSKRRKR